MTQRTRPAPGFRIIQLAASYREGFPNPEAKAATGSFVQRSTY
jgi:hypothetical protein